MTVTRIYFSITDKINETTFIIIIIIIIIGHRFHSRNAFSKEEVQDSLFFFRRKVIFTHKVKSHYVNYCCFVVTTACLYYRATSSGSVFAFNLI